MPVTEMYHIRLKMTTDTSDQNSSCTAKARSLLDNIGTLWVEVIRG